MYTEQCDSITKKDGLTSFTRKWIELEVVRFSKISKTQKTLLLLIIEQKEKKKAKQKTLKQ